MNLFRWVWSFLFGPRVTPLDRLLAEARSYGKITLAETDIEDGHGWYVTIRPRELFGDPVRSHRYTWSGQNMSMLAALEEALEEAREYPHMKKLDGIPYAPRLGTKEFDE